MVVEKQVLILSIVNDALRAKLRANAEKQIAAAEATIEQLRTEANRALISISSAPDAMQFRQQVAVQERQAQAQIAALRQMAAQVDDLQEGTLHQVGQTTAQVAVCEGAPAAILERPGVIVLDGDIIFGVHDTIPLEAESAPTAEPIPESAPAAVADNVVDLMAAGQALHAHR